MDLKFSLQKSKIFILRLSDSRLLKSNKWEIIFLQDYFPEIRMIKISLATKKLSTLWDSGRFSRHIWPSAVGHSGASKGTTSTSIVNKDSDHSPT